MFHLVQCVARGNGLHQNALCQSAAHCIWSCFLHFCAALMFYPPPLSKQAAVGTPDVFSLGNPVVAGRSDIIVLPDIIWL